MVVDAVVREVDAIIYTIQSQDRAGNSCKGEGGRLSPFR